MKTEMWQRIIRGQSLDATEPHTAEGRLDMRGLFLRDPWVADRLHTDMGTFNVLDGLTEIENVSWQGIDFSPSHLPGLRLSNCRIDNCVFDHCTFTDLRVWATEFSNSSFRCADLHDCSLGASFEGKPSIYRNIDFTSADLRESGFPAECINCLFRNTDLTGCQIHNCSFTDCCFEGELYDVTFHAYDSENKTAPPRLMKRVDFSRAKFWDTDFRGFDLDDVRFPEDDDHIIVDNIRPCLERLHAHFSRGADLGSQQMTVGLEHELKWMGKGRKTGVFRKSHVFAMVGEEGLRALLQIISKDARGGPAET